MSTPTHSLTYRVIIKGNPQEDAVLCTDNLTYDIKLAETSNSLLVCPTLTYPNDQLQGIFVCLLC